MSIVLDAWTSRNHFSFLAIEAYFIDELWKYQHVLIGFEQICGAHIEEKLQEIVWDVLRRCGIENRLLAVTINNASNNSSMMRKLEAILQEVCGSL